jgi:hypothetical protein
MNVDWHSWRVRFVGKRVEFDFDDGSPLVEDMAREGLIKKRLGQWCFTQLAHDILRDAYEARLNQAFRERDRYRATLMQIAEVYGGERDYPGRLARRALAPDQRPRQ